MGMQTEDSTFAGLDAALWDAADELVLAREHSGYMISSPA